MKDYYKILGVERNASDADIKKAYRSLAMKHHPDRGGDDTVFKEVNEAYSTLSDPAKKAEYDNPMRSQFSQGGFHNQGFDFNTIFDMFGTRFGDRPAPGGHRQATARIDLWISMRDVLEGGPRIISVSSPLGQNNVEITIPPGVEDGESLRYSRVAPGNLDLIVIFRIKPDPQWERHGANLVKELTTSIWDLILGTDLEVTTLNDEKLSIVVPPRTNPGTVLRVRGRGLPIKLGSGRGDLLIKVQGRMPDRIDDNLLEHIRATRTQ